MEQETANKSNTMTIFYIIFIIAGICLAIYTYKEAYNAVTVAEQEVKQAKDVAQQATIDYKSIVKNNKAKEAEVGTSAVLETDTLSDDAIVNAFNDLVNRARSYNEERRNKD